MSSLSSISLLVISVSFLSYFGSRVITIALCFFSSSNLAISSLDSIIIEVYGFSANDSTLKFYGPPIIEWLDVSVIGAFISFIILLYSYYI